MTDPLKQYAAAVLCGGRSLRMGFDKATALLNRRGERLLATLAAELATRFGDVLLVTNELAKISEIPELAPYTHLVDLHPGAGPAGGIHTALKAMPHKAIFIMACDMPVIDWPVIAALREVFESQKADIAVPRHHGLREPLYGFYGPLAEEVFQAGIDKGLRKVWLFYGELKTVYLDLGDGDLESGVFKNINTPDDIVKEGLPNPF